MNRRIAGLAGILVRSVIAAVILMLQRFPGQPAQDHDRARDLEKLAANYEYRLTTGSSYRLTNGLFEVNRSLDDQVYVKLRAVVVGDLNGDGRSDVAVILSSNYGGSGTFLEVTALVDTGRALKQANGLELGDRVEIKNLKVEAGEIVIDMLTHGPDDPMCCPSLKTTRCFRLTEGRLTEEVGRDSRAP